jgi:uncharacterized protein
MTQPVEQSLAAPVQDRVHVIDAIRALALYGVIAMNLVGMVMAIIPGEMMAKAGAHDYAFAAFDLIILQGKARSAFALLFGVGFGLLLARADAKGHDFVPFYLRRMTALLAIGLFNLAFLFFGDILILYALLGMVLILFRTLPDRALVRLGLTLVIVPPLLAGLGELVTNAPLPNLAGLTPAQVDALLPASEAQYRAGSYADFIGANLHYYADHYLAETSYTLMYDIGVLGLFLLGLWVARNGVLADVARWRPLLRRVAAICLPVGLLLSMVHGSRRMGVEVDGAAYALVTAAYVGLPVMAFGYVAALALWFSGRGRRAQAVLAPMGRLALTGYLGSNLIGGFFWYHWGLGQIGRWNIAAINLFAIGLFVAFCFVSGWWLRRYRFGPVEWLWRCASYGRVQPMRR